MGLFELVSELVGPTDWDANVASNLRLGRWHALLGDIVIRQGKLAGHCDDVCTMYGGDCVSMMG